MSLIEGERILGRYTVNVLRESAGTWSSTMMPMDATITNYRLMLRPHKKKYEPATLPGTLVRSAHMTHKGAFHCVEVLFVTNHFLYLILSTGKLDNFCEDLAAMKSPPPKFRFDDSVAQHDIERLINFFGRGIMDEGADG
jgi:hypothetical protein